MAPWIVILPLFALLIYVLKRKTGGSRCQAAAESLGSARRSPSPIQFCYQKKIDRNRQPQGVSLGYRNKVARKSRFVLPEIVSKAEKAKINEDGEKNARVSKNVVPNDNVTECGCSFFCYRESEILVQSESGFECKKPKKKEENQSNNTGEYNSDKRENFKKRNKREFNQNDNDHNEKSNKGYNKSKREFNQNDNDHNERNNKGYNKSKREFNQSNSSNEQKHAKNDSQKNKTSFKINNNPFIL